MLSIKIAFKNIMACKEKEFEHRIQQKFPLTSTSFGLAGLHQNEQNHHQ